MALRPTETSLGPGLGLGMEIMVYRHPSWTASHCAVVVVAIVVRPLLVKGGDVIDVLGIRRQVSRFDASINLAINA